MDKRSKFGLYAIGVFILGLIIADVAKPKPVNWNDSYSAADKIPLGCYVLYNQLEEMFPNFEESNLNIIDNRDAFYNKSNSTYILINDYLDIDKEETTELLDFVEDGNNVFISTLQMSGKLSDTLNFYIKRGYQNMGFKVKNIDNEFYSPYLEDRSANYNDVIDLSYFAEIDTVKTVALGYAKYHKEKTTTNAEHYGDYVNEDDNIYNYNTPTYEKELINYIKVPYGASQGAFYIHSNPYAFTNYHLLNNNEAYAEAVLSYAFKNNIIWDNYYKSGRKNVSSPLRFVLRTEALKWAFYISLVSLILFTIFNGKRKQRIIPIIEPNKNHTLEFTRTIGNLYFEHKNYSNLVKNKIIYFLEHVRTYYYLDTNNLSKKFIENLSVKSGKNIEEVNKLVKLIVHLTNKKNHSENDLINLNKKIEQFLKQ
ncbi:hypothetical protein NBRC110019_06650 [Neptunitalea chrysea]|uniref:DUF4350 domain-containing protein n=1 Tax=Neptunitalea chrysea TaxID=1647581 RepID=A0A9W6B3A1_9FLAO|nr:DUF4350 domain-containing protein [Neptunitalea chrysea]GLB51626.1 hypothetical protein NBRC110019_06650 [Neptunitalea chrysea]